MHRPISSKYTSQFHVSVALAFLIYRLMLKGAKHLSLRTVFRISGAWLLISSSSLVATGLDKIFSAGFLENFSNPIFSLEIPDMLSRVASFLESFAGIRFQPTVFHLVLFILFWTFVIYKDPLKFWRKA